MIERTIDWCARNRFLVFTGTFVLTLWGIWAMTNTPLDAVPDISDVQVIVSTEWMGRSPDLIEDFRGVGHSVLRDLEPRGGRPGEGTESIVGVADADAGEEEGEQHPAFEHELA